MRSTDLSHRRIARQMMASGVSVESFRAGFAEQRGDAVRFPDDGELSLAIQSQPAYHMLSRKDRLAELLWDLEVATRDKFALATILCSVRFKHATAHFTRLGT